MDNVVDWIEVDGMHRWLTSLDEWEVECVPTMLVIPDKQERLCREQRWYTRVPSSVLRHISQHSYRQLSAKVPRYQQHTIASSLKQRMVA
jgi:hypothetical protein